MKRRRFLELAAGAAAGALLPSSPALGAPGGISPPLSTAPGAPGGPGGSRRLVILHTNDTHSRIDPFPMDGGPFQGLGGVARRAALVRRIRDAHPHVLLLDSGDIFQGTPYFNFFRGEIDFRAMSAMGYDASTLGNHDFDNGVEGFLEMLPHATFPFVSANYDVSDSALAGRVRPWIVREAGKVRVGIFGLGIAFEGLVLPGLHEGVRYTDPFAAARRAVAELRGEGCSLVVCLSHMGYRYQGGRPSDTLLAREVEGIDLILGGHTHTFMERPDLHTRPGGSRTLVHQVGWGGMRLGRIDLVMEPLAGAGGGGSAGAAPRGAWAGAAPRGAWAGGAFRPREWRAGAYTVDGALDE